jgi:hypothetical protein
VVLDLGVEVLHQRRKEGRDQAADFPNAAGVLLGPVHVPLQLLVAFEG